jgi:hypothetical protein
VAGAWALSMLYLTKPKILIGAPHFKKGATPMDYAHRNDRV